ncbi:MAG: histidine kinase [Flavobacteriaceae bacterium]|nr:histidine kinase [Flavobacteriaceae bacterium]
MIKLVHLFRKNYKEILFQSAVFIVLFIFYSFDKHNRGNIGVDQFAFFASYSLVAFIINYVLLPKLYYKKKFKLFFLYLFLLCIGIFLVEELVLEKIYFPDTKGNSFSNFFYTLIGILPVIIIFVAFKFAWDFNKKQSEIEVLKTTIKDSELQFLKSQINPHFLFNNLNNLYSYALDNSPKTPSLILGLSSVLRYMLYDCKENFVSLSKEIYHLNDFITINELHIEDRGIVNFKTSNISQKYNIAPLILTVFVENAFKHSLANQTDNIKIDINVDINDSGQLVFECKNNYLTHYNTTSHNKGIGLNNVKKRLSLIYPKTHDLTISDEDNCFKVNLIIQLKPMTK